MDYGPLRNSNYLSNCKSKVYYYIHLVFYSLAFYISFTQAILLSSEVDYMGCFVNRDKQLKIVFYFVLDEILTPIILPKKYATKY